MTINGKFIPHLKEWAFFSIFCNKLVGIRLAKEIRDDIDFTQEGCGRLGVRDIEKQIDNLENLIELFGAEEFQIIYVNQYCKKNISCNIIFKNGEIAEFSSSETKMPKGTTIKFNRCFTSLEVAMMKKFGYKSISGSLVYVF